METRGEPFPEITLGCLHLDHRPGLNGFEYSADVRHQWHKVVQISVSSRKR